MKKLTDSDPETKSPDLVAQNLAQLKALFPELITEGKDGVAVNLDVLKQLVGDQTVTDAEEKYGLNWHGKRRARQLALTPSTGTLRPCPEDSVDWDTTQNLMIEGDNLEVLKLLQKSYAGKVKLIYIDPPYNTGKDFVYPDNFQDNIKNYLELTGQTGEGGKKLSSNTEASGRFHTDWLNMMYPRLKLARNLLREDGVICVSINDKEQHNLKTAMSEIFGEENILAQVVWDKNHSAQAGIFKVYHEYVLVYARGAELIAPPKAPDAEDFEAGAMKKESARHPMQEFRFPKGTRFDAQDGVELKGSWGDTEKVHLKQGRMISDNGVLGEEVVLEAAFTQANQMKQYFYGDRSTLVDSRGQRVVEFYFTATGKLKITKERGVFTPPTVQRWGMQGEISTELAKLFGMSAPPLETPKSPAMLMDLVAWFTESNDLIFDFFAGSGTTGHAVMEINSSSGSTRRFGLVQFPEPCAPDSDALKAGFKTIAQICKMRIKLAANAIRTKQPEADGDLGFRVFKLARSNIRAWEPDREKLAETLEASIEHLKTDRTEQDILFELLLKRGIDLCTPIESRSLTGHTVHSIGAGTLLACLSPAIPQAEVEPLALGIAAWHKELAPTKEDRKARDTVCIFRDSAFADDVAKTNLAAILQQHGLETVRSL